MTIRFIQTALIILSIASCNSIKHTSDKVRSTTFPSWALGEFIRPAYGNPVIAPLDSTSFQCPMYNKKISWESNDTFNPAAAVMNDEIYVLYRAEDKSGTGIGGRTSRIGLATSKDGIQMKRDSIPVLYPSTDSQKENEWMGGCEDPRVAVTEGGTYVMLYTQWNRKVPRLAVATSKDLRHWEKHGPAFQKAYNGKYHDVPSKSASIITKLIDNKQVIAKVDGNYFMYWGEQNVYAATSEDLINWKPLEDDKGELKILMSPRKGFFDSQLTECGPPAIMTNEGIVLLYNGKNLNGIEGDTLYTSGTYAAGQALFDLNNPVILKERLDIPFLIPTESFEKSGQYPAGTVFIEGLVYYHKKWFLYFGCADSRVAVAIADPNK